MAWSQSKSIDLVSDEELEAALRYELIGIARFNGVSDADASPSHGCDA
jgi:hypothetical protein